MFSIGMDHLTVYCDEKGQHQQPEGDPCQPPPPASDDPRDDASDSQACPHEACLHERPSDVGVPEVGRIGLEHQLPKEALHHHYDTCRGRYGQCDKEADP